MPETTAAAVAGSARRGSPSRHAHELRPEGLVIVSGTSRLLARQSCAKCAFCCGVLGADRQDPSEREKRHVMEEASVIETNENPFALDVQVITDVVPGAAAAACTSDDGCGSTCASACASTY
jgi:FxLD family lantipeptide